MTCELSLSSGNLGRDDRPVKRASVEPPLFIILGIAIVAAGLVALPAPGPGTVVLAIGAGLLARESKLIARGMDWLEVRLRRLFQWSKRRWHDTPLWGKGAIVFASARVTAGAAWAAYQVLLQR